MWARHQGPPRAGASARWSTTQRHMSAGMKCSFHARNRVLQHVVGCEYRCMNGAWMLHELMFSWRGNRGICRSEGFLHEHMMLVCYYCCKLPPTATGYLVHWSGSCVISKRHPGTLRHSRARFVLRSRAGRATLLHDLRATKTVHPLWLLRTSINYGVEPLLTRWLEIVRSVVS
jgi:hypothetical protein